MNSDTGAGNRGELIIPAARRSIHWHHNHCPFAQGELTMRRYEVDRQLKRHNVESPKTAETGHDEVDNVCSKFARPASPIPIRQNQKQRRNSLDEQNAEYSDDSKRLSKSLPDTFPSHLYYSEESNAEQSDLEASYPSQYQSVESNQSFTRGGNDVVSHSTQNYYALESANRSVISENTNFKNWQSNTENKATSIKLWHLLPVILCILIAFGISNWQSVWMPDTAIISSGKNYDKLKFYEDMSTVGKLYNLNEDSILQLQVGISSISEKEDTDSFMFVYNSEKDNFNSTVFNEFINHIATVSARYLRNESASVRHIVVDSSKLVVRDTDELIHKYSKDIDKGGVMVMKEIDTLPSSLAMALHYYCDVFSPLVKKSAIFFTLDVANCSDKTSTHAHIEKCLKKKWTSVSSESIGPLLARVVSVVVDVTSLF